MQPPAVPPPHVPTQPLPPETNTTNLPDPRLQQLAVELAQLLVGSILAVQVVQLYVVVWGVVWWFRGGVTEGQAGGSAAAECVSHA